jgi:hypothetical protein
MVPRATLTPADIKVFAVNGAPIDIAGCVKLNFKIQGRPVSAQLLVSDDIGEIILGYDWLSEQKATWLFGEKALQIHGMKVPLQVRKVKIIPKQVATVTQMMRRCFQRSKPAEARCAAVHTRAQCRRQDVPVISPPVAASVVVNPPVTVSTSNRYEQFYANAAITNVAMNPPVAVAGTVAPSVAAGPGRNVASIPPPAMRYVVSSFYGGDPVVQSARVTDDARVPGREQITPVKRSGDTGHDIWAMYSNRRATSKRWRNRVRISQWSDRSRGLAAVKLKEACQDVDMATQHWLLNNNENDVNNVNKCTWNKLWLTVWIKMCLKMYMKTVNKEKRRKMEKKLTAIVMC